MMSKLNEETLAELWESVGEDPRRFVSAEEVKLTGSIGSLDLEFSTEAPLVYEMVVRGTIEPINKDKDIASLKDVKVIVVPIKKEEEEVMENRLYKFSEVIQMLEEGLLPEGTKLSPSSWEVDKHTVKDGAYGLYITKDSDNSFGQMTSFAISALYKIEKPSPKRYKALHKVFTDYSVKPLRLFQHTDGSITLLSSFLDNGNNNTFTMGELKAFPINLNDFNLEEVLTTV